ncbi:hypothetical protein DFH09DRAFT_1198666, partial [Mycena vulgaris]
LSSLLQTVNLDFVWNWSRNFQFLLERHVDAIITWLKRCSPLPQPVITLWEESRFIIFCDSVFERPFPTAPSLSDAACHAILSQSPGLLRICQAWSVRKTACSGSAGWAPSLLYIQFLLEIPWDELRASIGPLRSILGEHGGDKIRALLNFTIRSTTICPEAYPWPTTCKDVARGCIRLLKFQDYRLPADIRDFSPGVFSCFDIHDVLQWLKGFPQPPLDVIEKWEKYQDQDSRSSGGPISTHELAWMECLDRMRN